MGTPQTAIIPDTVTAAIYIEANVTDKEQAKAACRQALAALDDCRGRFPGHDLGMTIAFGADFWHSLGHENEGREIRPFVPLGNGLCPATQCDLMIHIQSRHFGLNYLLAEQVNAAFGGSIRIENETHGFRMPEERGLDGFVDGTENPHGEEKIAAVGTIAQDQPDAGGSYIVLQKYLHDLKKWGSISVAEQEQAVGRSKADNIEFARADRLPDSHLGRTNIKENGIGLKIVRRSLPFGYISGEHGLQFIAYCATLHNIDEQLKFMFGDKDGKIDLLLKHMSAAVRSAYYYAPSIERLADL
mgnify:CR=1 FL=1